MLGWIHPTTSRSWIDDVGLLLSSSGFRRKWEIVVIDFNARPRSLWKRQLSLKVVVVVRKSPSRKIGFLKSLSFKGPKRALGINMLASTWFSDLVCIWVVKLPMAIKEKKNDPPDTICPWEESREVWNEKHDFFFHLRHKNKSDARILYVPESWLGLWKL